MWASLSSVQMIGVPSEVTGTSLSMVLDSVLSPSVDMMAKRVVDRDSPPYTTSMSVRGAHQGTPDRVGVAEGSLRVLNNDYQLNAGN